ncbi:ATP-dependent DNA ligase [Streptomyces sp. V1I6]|uniref:ATP-dependent DNA ligase n=1 Tax=Streptomyces sp. V1I6 TaxID=3042273 RepID=UPI00277E9F0A|nr:ATP-dependent DNA ligase [Streptomyces sp. V1I6]MDQ0840522.1 ATP-dependent DNA ligase [Streptomyces sp. V1I6]
MTWTLPEPMLTTPVSMPNVRPGCAAEPKWDGFRALVSVEAGQVVLRSRRGTEMAASFPKVVAGAVQLPDATAMDDELVVRDAAGRLAFERLQNRLARRGAGAARAAEEWPAHFVAFDLLRLSRTDTTGWSYRRRRAARESVFAARRLSAPWALCPSTTEADVVREWLTWASVGMEGLVFRRLDDAYRSSVRGWQKYKYKVRETSEVIVGAITGSLAVPRALLLGRHDDQGRLQYVGRTTTLAQAAGAAVDGLLARRRRDHPWTGWSFSAGWSSQEKLVVTVVEPGLGVEVGVDAARDASAGGDIPPAGTGPALTSHPPTFAA